MKAGTLKDIIAVPTSIATKNQAEGAPPTVRRRTRAEPLSRAADSARHGAAPARRGAALGIPLATLDEVPVLKQFRFELN